jgi:hypothetical protein
MAPKEEITILQEVLSARLRADPKDLEDWTKIDGVIKEMGRLSARMVKMHTSAEGGGRE